MTVNELAKKLAAHIEVGNWDLEVFLSECAGYYPIQTLAKQTTTAQGVEIVYLSLDEDSQR